MKTKLRLAVMVVCIGMFMSAWAHFPMGVNPNEGDGVWDWDWTPLQLGVAPLPCCQLVQGSAEVYGVAVGVLLLQQRSALASVALVNGIKSNYLAELGVLSFCDTNYVLNVGALFANCDIRNYGVNAGIFTHQQENFGLSVGAFTFCGANFGLCVGIRNAGSELYCPYCSDRPQSRWHGMQIGLVNEGDGLQIGLLNIGTGVQLGLLNYNEEGIAGCLPFINFPWR